jgi:hypothetical protein
MLRKISILLWVSLLAGCSDNFKHSAVAQISSDIQHGYIIRMDYSYRSFGGPCDFPQNPQTFCESDWIFTNTTNGVVSADHLTLWHGKSPQDNYGWPQKALLGSLTFSNGCMRVVFQVPDYRDDDTVRRHDPYKLNGYYKLEAK